MCESDFNMADEDKRRRRARQPGRYAIGDFPCVMGWRVARGAVGACASDHADDGHSRTLSVSIQNLQQAGHKMPPCLPNAIT